MPYLSVTVASSLVLDNNYFVRLFPTETTIDIKSSFSRLEVSFFSGGGLGVYLDLKEDIDIQKEYIDKIKKRCQFSSYYYFGLSTYDGIETLNKYILAFPVMELAFLTDHDLVFLQREVNQYISNSIDWCALKDI